MSNIQEAVGAARAISMLREDALSELARLGGLCDGPMIELGPYIGGSTCALTATGNARLVTVEMGGPNRDHPQLPTDDTVADLEANLDRAGVRSRVEIVVGHFRDERVFDEVRKHLAGAEAGLLFVDVTPGSEIAVQQYAGLLHPNAYVVIDDYISDHATEKAAQVQAFVDQAVARGILTAHGVLGWGTWFGQLSGGDAIERLREVPVSMPLWPPQGNAWVTHVGHTALSDDQSGNSSPLELLEDGRPLGPAHTAHETIRQRGLGGYSHWNGMLYFSSSDNSSPQDNGRKYAIRVDGSVWDLRRFGPLPS